MPLIRVLGQLGAKQFLCDKVLASVTRRFICYDTTPVHDNSKSRFHLEFSSMNYLLSVFHIIGGQTIHDLSIVLFLDKHHCDALRDLVPFVQFKKREKHPWKSVTFSKEACNFTKSKTPPA